MTSVYWEQCHTYWMWNLISFSGGTNIHLFPVVRSYSVTVDYIHVSTIANIALISYSNAPAQHVINIRGFKLKCSLCTLENWYWDFHLQAQVKFFLECSLVKQWLTKIGDIFNFIFSFFRDILLMETGFLTILVSPLNLFKARTNYRYTCKHPSNNLCWTKPNLDFEGVGRETVV